MPEGDTRWMSLYAPNGDVFVVPLEDTYPHSLDAGDCLCGPSVEAVPRDDGSHGWLYVHHSLDGRENSE